MYVCTYVCFAHAVQYGMDRGDKREKRDGTGSQRSPGSWTDWQIARQVGDLRILTRRGEKRRGVIAFRVIDRKVLPFTILLIMERFSFESTKAN